jgi:tetratricopeptide (TPR) repeat protein
MPGKGTVKVLLVSGALILTVLLYLAPKKALKPATPSAAPKAAFSFNDLLKFQEKNLDAREKRQSDAWLESLKASDNGNLSLYDSLASLWDGKRMFALSGHYYEEKAGRDKAEQSYLRAAYRYFDAYKQAVDSTMKEAMVSRAISNYEKVLEVNPGNDDARTDLGVLYAEATPQPMKGIRLLQEVVASNPSHENAQLNLGILSVRSQQYDKALARFDNVLKINPQRHDVMVLKAQVYMQMGKKREAVEELEKYKRVATDAETTAQVDRLLDELKKE